MAIFGYVIYLIFCLIVTFYCGIASLFGGTDLTAASGKVAIFCLVITSLVWYFAYQWFPFEVSVK